MGKTYDAPSISHVSSWQRRLTFMPLATVVHELPAVADELTPTPLMTVFLITFCPPRFRVALPATPSHAVRLCPPRRVAKKGLEAIQEKLLVHSWAMYTFRVIQHSYQQLNQFRSLSNLPATLQPSKMSR